ncbi:MAG TPA: helix-turn-helix domain-containing protein [Solirubrobacteraceae bacterium]
MKTVAGVDLPPGHGDDVLAQATRRRLFALLGEHGGSASTDELAQWLGLHPNGVRTHLQRMRDAGLVSHRRVPRPRGRPHDEWAIAPTAAPGGDPPHAYGALAGWLARTIPATPRRLREVEAAGREIGRGLAPAPVVPPAQAIVDALAALGFQPEALGEAPDGRLSCRLRNCPYRDSVRENREVICTLHRGLTRGLLDRIAPTATLARFVPHDPGRAGCEVDIEGLVS